MWLEQSRGVDGEGEGREGRRLPEGPGPCKEAKFSHWMLSTLVFFWALPLSQELCRVLGRVQASKSSALHLGLLGLCSWTPGEALGLSLGPETCSESLWKQNTPFQHPAASLLEMILNFFFPQGD